MKQVRIGIMGAGGIAKKFAHAAKITEGAEITCVSSKSKERAETFARDNNIPNIGSYEEMLQRDDVDAVYVATTHNFHYENVKMCLENGKHTVCEKPMVLHQREAEELFSIAERKNLFLMEAMWSRFLPAVQQAKKWITSGKIGRVQSVSAVIGFKSTRDPSSRLLNPELAGGAVYDIGVYPIEISQYLVGEKITDAVGFRRDNPLTGVDENDTFIVRFETCDAAVQCLFTSSPREYVIVNGEDGVVELTSVSGCEESLLYNGRRELAGCFRERSPEGNGFVFELREIVDCINSGKITSSVMPPEDTIRSAWVYDRILGNR